MRSFLKWFNMRKSVINLISSTAQTSQAGSNVSTAQLVNQADTNQTAHIAKVVLIGRSS